MSSIHTSIFCRLLSSHGRALRRRASSAAQLKVNDREGEEQRAAESGKWSFKGTLHQPLRPKPSERPERSRGKGSYLADSKFRARIGNDTAGPTVNQGARGLDDLYPSAVDSSLAGERGTSLRSERSSLISKPWRVSAKGPPANDGNSYDLEAETFSQPDSEVIKDRRKGKQRRRLRPWEISPDSETNGSLPITESQRTTISFRRSTPVQRKNPQVTLPPFLSVSQLARVLGLRIHDLSKRMAHQGFENTNFDYVMDADTASAIAADYNFDVNILDELDKTEVGAHDLFPESEVSDTTSLPLRSPIVTIMGHVDHGKTTILDHLRKSNVAGGEAGGITQHLGAFQVKLSSEKMITFLDTPGHAAFLSMRERGARITDIIVLVVAADDGVMPQTTESIRHCMASKVPIVVALNKIDKFDANIDKVKQQLIQHGLELESAGGDVQVVPISGLTGQNFDQLEEAIITLSEVLDLRASAVGKAEGWVLESSVKRTKGKSCAVLVRKGCLKPGSIIVAGTSWCKIRTMSDQNGQEVHAAFPGVPVEVTGWKELPSAGDQILEAINEEEAKDVIHTRESRAARLKQAEDMNQINRKRYVDRADREADVEKVIATDSNPLVHLIVKADVSGSVEAVTNAVAAIGTESVGVNVVHSNVGDLTESDLQRASAGNAQIIAFNVKVGREINQLATQLKIPIMQHNIIYRLLDDIRQRVSEKLPFHTETSVVGEADVLKIFEISLQGRKKQVVAGCRVTNGSLRSNSLVRILRNKEELFSGHVLSLKNVKKEVSEMRKGTECGVSLDGWEAFEIGDTVQTITTKAVQKMM